MPVRDNRYARKRQHKRELKKKHAIRFSKFDAGLDERDARREYEEDLASGRVFKWQDPRNGGYNYWVDFSLTGPRSYAKYCTNRKIRAKFRNMLANLDPENIVALTGSQYEKEFDYWWTIY